VPLQSPQSSHVMAAGCGGELPALTVTPSSGDGGTRTSLRRFRRTRAHGAPVRGTADALP
jgi:hypothetical protein